MVYPPAKQRRPLAARQSARSCDPLRRRSVRDRYAAYVRLGVAAMRWNLPDRIAWLWKTTTPDQLVVTTPRRGGWGVLAGLEEVWEGGRVGQKKKRNKTNNGKGGGLAS